MQPNTTRALVLTSRVRLPSMHNSSHGLNGDLRGQGPFPDLGFSC